MQTPQLPLEPGATIGIFGGGQLGRMLALAAAKLGLRAAIYAPEADSAAFDVAAWPVCAPYEDEAAAQDFAARCGVVTFEFENIPVATLEAAARAAPVRPAPRAVEIAQNRIREKAFLTGLGFPVAPYAAITTADEAEHAAALLETWPGGGILKRAAYGYDGKGQVRLSRAVELRAQCAVWRADCVLERRMAFTAEASVIGVRAPSGAFAAYDVPRNLHEDGILRRCTVPAGLSAKVCAGAVAMARTLADAIDYAGVLGVEFFVVGEGDAAQLIVNEFAPRVHNSGHWTLDACTVSQFENHIRAVAGWPLGSAARHSDAVMTNLLGDEVLKWRERLVSGPSSSLWLYGKRGVQAGRKLGHVTEITPRGRADV